MNNLDKLTYEQLLVLMQIENEPLLKIKWELKIISNLLIENKELLKHINNVKKKKNSLDRKANLFPLMLNFEHNTEVMGNSFRKILENLTYHIIITNQDKFNPSNFKEDDSLYKVIAKLDKLDKNWFPKSVKIIKNIIDNDSIIISEIVNNSEIIEKLRQIANKYSHGKSIYELLKNKPSLKNNNYADQFNYFDSIYKFINGLLSSFLLFKDNCVFWIILDEQLLSKIKDFDLQNLNKLFKQSDLIKGKKIVVNRIIFLP